MANNRIPRSRWLAQRVTASWFSIVLALQSGCVTGPPVPKTQHQATLGKVAVIATSQKPEIQLEGFAHSKGEGAATGAGSTFLECMRALGDSGCSGEICGAVVILMLGVCGVASAVGGVVGAIATPGAEEVQASEDSLSTALNAKAIQESLRYQTEAAALVKGTSLVSVAPESVQAAVHGATIARSPMPE